MINIRNCLTIVIIIFLSAAGNISTSGAGNNDFKTARNFTTAYKYGDEAQDTTLPKQLKLPKPPSVPALPKPPKPNNLFKRIAEIFRFRKYSHLREQARVTIFVDSLIADSIYASEENVRFLINNLADTINQNADSLQSLVKYLKKREYAIYANQHYLDSTQADLDRKFRSLDDYVRISKDKYASKEVSDKDLNILASKIFPIIDVNTDIKVLTAKMNRISMLKKIQDSLQIARTMFDTATNTEKNYWVRTKNKIEVYGFYNYFTGSSVQIDKLNNINTFIYNSLFINSQTGDIKYLNGWDTAEIVPLAQSAGCSVAVTFTIENENELYDFLNNRNSQYNFIRSAIYLMKSRSAGSINISFNNITPEENSSFNFFIKNLYQQLKEKDNRYKLLLTIPATIVGNNYDLYTLSGTSDRIIIDFSRNYDATGSPMTSFMRLPESVPITPMASLTALSKVVSFFIKARVPPEKIVVCLPYRGTKWQIGNGYEDRVIEYITYSTIRKNYPFAAYTSYLVDSTGTAVMDSLGYNRNILRRIFYEDESTISKKYDFILKNGIGGVAVNGLGDDFGYTGLWDEMLFAFAIADTVYDKGNTVKKYVRDSTLGFFAKLSRQFSLYSYILQNPCEVCFENAKDTAEKGKIYQYLLDLDVESQMIQANAILVSKHEDTFRSYFEFVTYQLTSLLKIITIVSFIILLVLGYVYIKKVKNTGDKWNWKKKMEGILIGISVLFILFLFSLLFASDAIPFFGATVSNNGGYSKWYAAAIHSTEGREFSTGYCEPDPESTCVNMPLLTLLSIIITVLGVGFLLTRYLILPLIKRDEIP